MGKTNIEWCDAVWNPVRGCSHVSPGCENCYAAAIAARFLGPGMAFEGFAEWRCCHTDRRFNQGDVDLWAPKGRRARWTGRVELLPHKLDEPLRWKRPRRVFVNSMADLFHEKLT